MYFRNPLQGVISSESNVYILMIMMWFALRKNMIFKMFLILRSSQQGHLSWFCTLPLSQLFLMLLEIAILSKHWYSQWRSIIWEATFAYKHNFYNDRYDRCSKCWMDFRNQTRFIRYPLQFPIKQQKHVLIIAIKTMYLHQTDRFETHSYTNNIRILIIE